VSALETPRYRFFTRGTGAFVDGPVQGAGGSMVSYERILAAHKRALEGRPHGLCEPKPGCLVVYPQFSYLGNGPPTVVDLRTIVRVEPRGFSVSETR
jgi:hypothetical protein